MKNILILFSLVLIIVQCDNKTSEKKPVLTHWLNGSYQAESSEGLVEETWEHPRKEYWVGLKKTFQNNQVTSEQEFEIKIVDDVLSLVFQHEGNTITLPSTKADMTNFEFARPEDVEGPNRVKFEKTSDRSFRRVDYNIVNGRNRINMYDFKKIRN